jgi:hypothetical protein
MDKPAWLDTSRAVDLLAAQSDVDPRRIGAIGHSLGAKKAQTRAYDWLDWFLREVPGQRPD